MSVMAINYRLSPEVSFPDHYLDCARAIQFARSQAAAWNINPERIGAAGGSAGAGAALWIAFHQDLAAQDDADVVRRQSSRLKCVAVTDAQTSYDPRAIKEWIGELAASHPMLPMFYGLAPGSRVTPATATLYEDASPINHLTDDDPPVYAYYSEDGPIAASGKPGRGIHHVNFGIRLKKKMDSLGIPCVVRSHAEGANWNEEMIAFLTKNL
jgi:acetyl esterase/lipase